MRAIKSSQVFKIKEIKILVTRIKQAKQGIKRLPSIRVLLVLAFELGLGSLHRPSTAQKNEIFR